MIDKLDRQASDRTRHCHALQFRCARYSQFRQCTSTPLPPTNDSQIHGQIIYQTNRHNHDLVNSALLQYLLELQGSGHVDRLTSVPIKEKLGLLRDHERRWRQMILTPRLQPIACPDPHGTWIDSELRDGLLVQVYYNDDTEQSTVILNQLPTCFNPMVGSS